jgi:hypothetical protein
MQEFLLIGGSRDGERIMLEVRRDLPPTILSLPVRRPENSSVFPFSNEMEEPEVDHYMLRAFMGKHENHIVYAIQDMSVDTILEKLIDRYGR